MAGITLASNFKVLSMMEEGINISGSNLIANRLNQAESIKIHQGSKKTL